MALYETKKTDPSLYERAGRFVGSVDAFVQDHFGPKTASAYSILPAEAPRDMLVIKPWLRFRSGR